MEKCSGMLLVHVDASPAACTEELEGRCCPGTEALHLGGRVACQEVLGPGACEMCALEALSPRQWRHSVHLAVRLRRARHCTEHRHSRPPVSPEVEVDAWLDALHVR